MALQEELERQGNWLFRYRSVLPLVILTFGIIVYIQSELNQDNFLLRVTPYEMYGEMFFLLISLLGLVIRVFTVGYIPKDTSGRRTKKLTADKLNTNGIYSIVRHPLYFGNFFMWLGPCMLTGNFWFIISFCLFYLIYYERIMFAEEQFLRKKFENEYLDWAENVPAFLPNFKNFIKPDLSFNWKKVLQKERNGLFVVFIIFCFFDVCGELINNGENYNLFLITASVLTGLNFLILKYLEKRTNILDDKN